MKLKPCPFCGTKDISISRTYIDPLLREDSLPDEVHVTCSACGLGGYAEETEEEAVEAWNRRA